MFQREVCNFSKILIPLAVLMLMAFGCSGGGDVEPTSPDYAGEAAVADESSHHLLGYWMFEVNEDHTRIDVQPVRSIEKHFNVRMFLENGPCYDCLIIGKVQPHPGGVYTVTVKLRHPFVGTDVYTGFDVRGIPIFHGSKVFPASGLVMSDAALGNPELFNPDGYTRLFNPVEYAPGTKPAPVYEYQKGKFANPGPFETTLNAFKYFYTDYENRNFFKSGHVIAVDYDIYLPGGAAIFAYAVDASWAFPNQLPPMVPGSFPISANSIEAYEISALGPMDGYHMNDCPGSNDDFRIFIRDHQGGDTIGGVRLECPELFDGYVDAVAYGQVGDAWAYDVVLTNEKAEMESGNCDVLVEVRDTVEGSLFHHIAYQVFQLDVLMNQPPQASASVEGSGTYKVGEPVKFHSQAVDPNGPDDIVKYEWDFDGDSNYEGEGKDPVNAFDIPGVYNVQHRVIDRCGEVGILTEPILVTIIEGGVEITLPEDTDYKTYGRIYWFESDEMPFSELPVDLGDLDGPWDFTTFPLPNNVNHRKIIDKDDPEVAPIAGWFNPSVQYFVRLRGNIYDITDGMFYQAEEHNVAQDVLKMWGAYEPGSLGAVAFPSPIVIPFPINKDTYVHDYIGIPGLASFTYDYIAMGEGAVIVPYEGMTSYVSLMMRIFIKIETPDSLNASGLLYEWLEDDGKSVAIVAAMNDPDSGIYNFDEDTLTFYDNGIVTVNALYAIVDD